MANSYEDAKKEANKEAKKDDAETREKVQGMTDEEQAEALARIKAGKADTTPAPKREITREEMDKAGDKLAAIMKGKPQDK